MSVEKPNSENEIETEKALDAPPQDEFSAMAQLSDPNFEPIFMDHDRVSRAEYIEDPEAKPVFDFELNETDEVSAGIKNNWGSGPSPGYRERHRAIARYNALGMSNNEIAKKLNYSPTAISLVLKKPWIQEEVSKFRTQFFDEDINRALKAAGSDAIKHIHKTILDENEKSELRSTNARWITEKLTGKARQEVNVESNTLGSFIELLREVRDSGQPLEPVTLDITPTDPDPKTPEIQALPEAPQGPDFHSWIKNNL